MEEIAQDENGIQEESKAALQKALALLARCEQCRAGLERKLLQRGFSKAAVAGVLDVLEEKDFLNDERFARAWLNSRRITKLEGRTRLLAELCARGISREVSKKAVDGFFLEFDEGEICLKAAKKYAARGYQGQKFTAAMLRSGFSKKMSDAALLSVSAP